MGAVPGKDFTIEDEFAWEIGEGCGEFGEFDDFIEGAGEKFYSGGAFVDLGADAVVFFLNYDRSRAIGKNFGGGFDRSG